MAATENTQRLSIAIAEMKILLARTDVPEGHFQTWFEEHPVVFEALGYRTWIPHPRFPLTDGRYLVPDFLVEDFNGVWSIFELKRHDTKVLKNAERRTDLRSEFSTYVQQCREYALYFSDSESRRFALEQYNIHIQREVPSVVVASTDDATDYSTARDLLVDRGNRVELRTYSEVLRTLLRQLDWTSADTARRPGISMGLLGTFPIAGPEQVLFDVGRHKDRNRFTIGLAGGRIFFTLIDSDGRHQRWDVERPLIIEYANATSLDFLEVEVGVSPGSLYVAGYLNRRCVLRQESAATRVVFEDLAGGMAIGTDVTGKADANFGLVEAFAYMRTLAPSERIQIYEHLDEVYSYYLSPLAIHAPLTILISKGRWMTTAGHPLSSLPSRNMPDTTGPWGWWMAAEGLTLNNGQPVPRDPRLGVRTIALPGMKNIPPDSA